MADQRALIPSTATVLITLREAAVRTARAAVREVRDREGAAETPEDVADTPEAAVVAAALMRSAGVADDNIRKETSRNTVGPTDKNVILVTVFITSRNFAYLKTIVVLTLCRKRCR